MFSGSHEQRENEEKLPRYWLNSIVPGGHFPTLTSHLFSIFDRPVMAHSGYSFLFLTDVTHAAEKAYHFGHGKRKT
ncbi:hypothetical protein [Methylobacter sp.]|uniref:hypothetical protein n=1 Tax=Methylobacter sp. TaxID=2051955 RepID=UPI003DA1F2D9